MHPNRLAALVNEVGVVAFDFEIIHVDRLCENLDCVGHDHYHAAVGRGQFGAGS